MYSSQVISNNLTHQNGYKVDTIWKVNFMHNFDTLKNVETFT